MEESKIFIIAEVIGGFLSTLEAYKNKEIADKRLEYLAEQYHGTTKEKYFDTYPEDNSWYHSDYYDIYLDEVTVIE